MKSELLTKLSCGKSLSECPEKLNEKTPIFKKSSSASINFMKTNNCKEEEKINIFLNL